MVHGCFLSEDSILAVVLPCCPLAGLVLPCGPWKVGIVGLDSSCLDLGGATGDV